MVAPQPRPQQSCHAHAPSHQASPRFIYLIYLFQHDEARRGALRARMMEMSGLSLSTGGCRISSPWPVADGATHGRRSTIAGRPGHVARSSARPQEALNWRLLRASELHPIHPIILQLYKASKYLKATRPTSNGEPTCLDTVLMGNTKAIFLKVHYFHVLTSLLTVSTMTQISNRFSKWSQKKFHLISERHEFLD